MEAGWEKGRSRFLRQIALLETQPVHHTNLLSLRGSFCYLLLSIQRGCSSICKPLYIGHEDQEKSPQDLNTNTFNQ